MRLALRRDRGCTAGRHADGALLALAMAAATAACEMASTAGAPLRETLPNGAVLVRYPSLPAIDSVGPEVTEAQVDLRIGTLDGNDPNYIFGDIRGVQAAGDGTIYVLDYQAVEVRAYSRDGEHLRTVVRQGEGPGEISRANGILLSGDTLLWINDHWKRQIIGVDPAGNEVRRFDNPVPNSRYIWTGTFDDRGRYWRLYREYYRYFDLSTGRSDSVYMGATGGRSYVQTSGTGQVRYHIPFVASPINIVQPSGGLWHAHTASYRLSRTRENGDTVVVIEAVVPVHPVTAEDRAAYVQLVVDVGPGERRSAEAAAELIPDVKPILESFFVDDEGRLWVERATPNDVPPFYDLFSQGGDYLGSVRLAFEPRLYSKVTVQHGNLYTWVVDELDTPFVVRAPVS